MNHTEPVDIAAYEAERAEIKGRYTPLLKAMSASNPGYARLWNERADKLRELADRYTLPTGAEEQRNAERG